MTPPSSSTVGPLTILAGSQGFSASGVYDYLASKTVNDTPLQALGLSFYGSGLANGGLLNFSLNITNQSSPPQLVSQTPGVTIALQPAADSSSTNTKTGTGTTISETPEPLSVLVWVVLTGVGLLRVRASRKP